MPEAFALIRESMDRHIGIREIFNPEQNFDPDQFDDAMLEAYDAVQRAMINADVSLADFRRRYRSHSAALIGLFRRTSRSVA